MPAQWGCEPNSPYPLNVTTAVAAAAAGDTGKATFGVRAVNESFPQGRLTFAHDADLEITYTYKEPFPVGYGSFLPIARSAPTDWAYVESGHRNVPHWSESGPAPAGAQDHHRVARSFFRYDTSELSGNKPLAAQVWMQRADACRIGEHPLELWETGPIASDTTWHHQPEWIRRLGVYTWGSCQDPAIYLMLDATQAVADAVAAGRTTLTLGLRGQDEHDPLGAYAVAHDSMLRAEYVPPIGTPTDPLTDSTHGIWPEDGTPMPITPCVSGADRPFVPFAPLPTVQSAGIVRHSARWQWETLDGPRAARESRGHSRSGRTGSRTSPGTPTPSKPEDGRRLPQGRTERRP